MLSHLHIRNFAIIDEVELELDQGLSVLTGVTGAGKSILLDALGLLLGDRGDASFVRHGAQRAELSATFELDHLPHVQAWLESQDLAADQQAQVRRSLGSDGRSRAYINGQSVPVQSLRGLGEQLVDIHGQHEHQSLSKRAVQLDLLDYHGKLMDQRAAVAATHRKWQLLQDRLEGLQGSESERGARLDLLRYQCQELTQLNLTQEELPELEDEHRKLANSGRIAEQSRACLDALYEAEEINAYQSVTGAVHLLEPLTKLDPNLSAILEMLKEASIQVQEASDQLGRYLSDLDMDPSRLEWVEERLAAIHALARKHRCTAGELPALALQLVGELDELENADQNLEKLSAEAQKARAEYLELAGDLSDKRGLAARDLGEQVSAIMQQLGMQGGKMVVALEQLDEARFRQNGLDRVEFLVSANPGQPPAALSKVASGGELSRISLAIQVVAAAASRIPTMIFDEVDAGVGGGIAEIVGKRMRELGGGRQVLCVTHLPQVASQAHSHLKVTKLTDGEHTRTRIHALNGDETVEELARMLGGVKITERTREHAREMLETASQPRRKAL
ncbi:MAG: DNA repair protein RecN [Gammaproteobacteria bacterium]|nr:DNA repair protein RecN [Gammaproteobacteria bacterium]